MTKDLTIIIPHYNSVETLIKLLSTIPDDKRLEVIVVDDKSEISNEQRERIIHCIGERGLLLDNVTNKKGAGICRNIGIEHAVGEWLIFADADDYFVPEAFNVLFENVNNSAEVVFFNMTSIKLNSGTLSNRHIGYSKLVKNHLLYNDELSEFEIRANWSSPTTKLIKKILIDRCNIRFDETSVANDVMFSLRVGMSAQSIDVIDRVIYCATQNIGTLTTDNSYDKIKIRFEKYWEKYYYLDKMIGRKNINKLGMGSFQFLICVFRRRHPALGIKTMIESKSYKSASVNFIGWLRKHVRFGRTR